MKKYFIVYALLVSLFLHTNAQKYWALNFATGISHNESYSDRVYVDFIKPWFAFRTGAEMGYVFKTLDFSVGLWATAKSYRLTQILDKPKSYYDIFLQVPFVIDWHKKFGIRTGLINSFYILPASITFDDETNFYVPEILLGLSYHNQKFKISIDFNRELLHHFNWESINLTATYNMLLLNFSYFINRRT